MLIVSSRRRYNREAGQIHIQSASPIRLKSLIKLISFVLSCFPNQIGCRSESLQHTLNIYRRGRFTANKVDRSILWLNVVVCRCNLSVIADKHLNVDELLFHYHQKCAAALFEKTARRIQRWVRRRTSASN